MSCHCQLQLGEEAEQSCLQGPAAALALAPEMRKFGGAVDLNISSLGGLDASMLSMGGGGCDDTARLQARHSLSTSQFGRGSFVRPGGAPPSSKKPVFASGRPSLAPQPGDRCVAPLFARAILRQPPQPPMSSPLLLTTHLCALLPPVTPRRLSAAQGRPTLGGGMSAPKLRADMPDPRPLNTAAWKADAAQKVRATAPAPSG